MATLPQVEFAEYGGAVIELDEELEGDQTGSTDYLFHKIGTVPVELEYGNVEYNRQSLPSQPLAVSDNGGFLFVAHPLGFYVARTEDVMESAKAENIIGRSIKDISLSNVSIGKVSILALSFDESVLAASVANHVHFFAVSALLNEELEPSYSVTLDDSIFIKDIRWAPRNELNSIVQAEAEASAEEGRKNYVILSAEGKLYHGSGQNPLMYVMEGVDSVDWSPRDDFLAVAKRNTVSILSGFQEKLKFLLRFQLAIGDSNVHQVIKVDAIRWIREDYIVVGCFQLSEDGEEENYIVQVITSRAKGERIIDASASSKPAMLSFITVFLDFQSDAVPARNGPHLFLSYLQSCWIALIANRNLSQQVELLCLPGMRSEADRIELIKDRMDLIKYMITFPHFNIPSHIPERIEYATMVEILNDAGNLHINSQENGEDNLIVGICSGKADATNYGIFMVHEDEVEMSPQGVVFCLTVDGKISIFQFLRNEELNIQPSERRLSTHAVRAGFLRMARIHRMRGRRGRRI